MAEENIREQSFCSLMDEVVKGLKQKIANGEATASDYKNAIELLKNNGITFETGKSTEEKGKVAAGILDDLPYDNGMRVVK